MTPNVTSLGEIGYSVAPGNKSIGLSFQITKKCNFNCSYCYEVGQHRDESSSVDTHPDVFKLIDEIHADTGLNFDLTFIGGEPTLNAEYATPIINYILDKGLLASVSLITNGWSAELVETFFGRAPKEKIHVQVSYDGREINDKFRKQQGKTTSDLVLMNFKSLLESGYLVTLKSTLPIDALHTVPEILQEFRKMATEYKTRIRYSPTEDFTTTFRNTRDFSDFKEYFDSSFKAILEEELKGLKENRPAISRWFDEYSYEATPQCNAGITFFTINEDGNVQYCHHVDYSKDAKEQLDIINISQPDAWTKMKKFATETKACLDEQDSECRDCTAMYCVKCPIINFSITKDKGKMHGKHAIPFMCEYYQAMTKYLFTYKKIKEK